MADDARVQQLLEELLSSDAAPEDVCASCPELLPVVRDRLRQMRRLRADLDFLFPSGGDPGPPSSDGTVLPPIPGYEIEEVLGRGGMGVVFRARHLRLNRVVAVKTVQAGAYAGRRELDRFQREAEAVAALRHPNIVQIHDIGDVNGRPYFTMELVEGGSLAQKLGGIPQPAPEAAALVQTLAGAVQAAHQSGVVHRDLKPGNVLLTADGTPKITDFGLARRLEGEAALTQSGVPVGTPSYMAPEQARADAHATGPAVDVYALGAILYELLTGRPPFRAATAAETMHQVISQEPAAPSRLNDQVPRDLETICLKCLHKEPARRYGSASELADDLRSFGEGRPIKGRPVGWPERTWRWGRRKPTTAGLLAALLALFTVTGGGGLWLARQQAGRQGRARVALETALAQVPGLRQLGRWSEAQAVLAQARSRLDEANSDGLRRRLGTAEADLRLAAALEQIRLTPALEVSHIDYRGMAEAYAQAFEHAGLNVREDEETVVVRIRDSDLRQVLVMALDHWAYVCDALEDRQTMTRLLDLAQRADPDPVWGDRFRKPALWQDPEALRGLAAEAQERLAKDAPKNGPPTPLVTLLAKKLGQEDNQAEPLLRAAQFRRPEDFWLNYALGEALRESKPADAVGFYRAALATRPTVAGVHGEAGLALLRLGQADEAVAELRRTAQLDPNLAMWAHYNLGSLLRDKGQLDEAMAEFRHASELDPKAGAPHHHLGVCWHAKGQLAEAMAEFRQAIRLDAKAGAPHHAPHHHLGMCWQAKGQLDEAMAEFRQAIRLDPKGAAPHRHLGMCWRDKGQLDEAMAEFRQAIRLDPKTSVLHYQLAECLRDKGELDEAMAEFRQAIRLDPKTSVLHYQLGEWLRAKGQLDEAMSEFRKAIELDPKASVLHYQLGECLRAKGQLDEAMAEFRNAIELDPKGAGAHHSLGSTHAARRQWAQGAACFARALEGGSTDDGSFWFEYAALLMLSGDRPGYARACAHMIERFGNPGGPGAGDVVRACVLAPDVVAGATLPARVAEKEFQAAAGASWSLTAQGALHHRGGRFPQAVVMFEQSLRADPKPGQAVLNWLWLALANQRLDKPEEARRWLNKGQTWLDQYSDGMPTGAEAEVGLPLHNWLEAHVLRREAEALIRPAAPGKDADQRAPDASPK